MSKILITSGGFLSSNLVRELEKDPAITEIVVWTDPQGKKNTEKVRYTFDPDLENQTYSTVFHTFWNPSQAAPPQNHIDNIQFTLDLLEQLEGRPRFIFVSSITVESPSTFYAASKIAGENLVRRFMDEKKIVGICARPCAIIGNSKRGLLPDLIKKVKEDSDTLYLQSNSRKPYVDVVQTANVLAHLGKYGHPQFMTEICSSFTMSVDEIARMVMKKLGREKRIVWGQSYSGDANISGRVTEWQLMDVEEAVEMAIDEILADQEE